MPPVEPLTFLGQAGLAGGTAFGLTFVLTPLVRAIALRWGCTAKPTGDRWGRRVVARLGGAAMFLGLFGSILLWVPPTPTLIGLLGGVMAVFALGLVDDLRRMPAYTKLVAQLLIGCVVVFSGIRFAPIPWSWLSIPVSVLWFVLVMNAFNLLDNMDGLAAGVGAIAAAFCAVHGLLAGQGTVTMVAVIVLGMCLGFLRYNFPPAKIFMGDSGSHVLGFSLAALGLLGSWRHSTQLLSVITLPALILAVPIFDTCFVTLQRLTHQQHPFVGGTDHVSHRLAILGLSPRQTALALYIVSALLGSVSIFSVHLKSLQAGVVWLIVLAVLVLVGRYLARVNVYRIEPQSQGAPAAAERSSTFIETMLLHKRRLVEILVDFTLISSSYVVAYLLRFEGTITGDLQQLIAQSLPVILVIKLVSFAGCGLYRGVWRYLGLADIMTVFRSVTLGSILSSLTLLYLWRFEGYSRAVLVIDWLLSFLCIGGSRVVERLLDDWIGRATPRGVPTVILGAGDTGAQVVSALQYARKPVRTVLGFLDDDAKKHGTRIYGYSVLGGRARLAEILDRSPGCEVLIAINDPPGELLQYVRACCEPRGVSWKVVMAGVTDAVG